MIGFKEIWGMNLCDRFPSVVAFGVPLPFDKILQGSAPSVVSVADDALNFKLLFAINQIRGWS
jgi:hypothetical protein